MGSLFVFIRLVTDYTICGLNHEKEKDTSLPEFIFLGFKGQWLLNSY